jgi:nitrilase
MRVSHLLVTTLSFERVCCHAATAFNNTNFTVAMVRQPPPNWPMPILNMDWTGVVMNISEAVDDGIRLMHKAAEGGANLVTFPELWFPG